MVFALYPECRNALIEGGGGNDNDNNKSINRTITACLLRSLEPMTASALGNEDELLRMAPAALWKIIKEYGKISFDTKWKLFTELQNMKISSDYKNYYEVVKQFDERVCRFEEAGLTIKELRSTLFLNIMPDSARQFLRTSNQVSEEDSKVKG